MSLNSKPTFFASKKRPSAELKLLGYVIKAHLHTQKGAERDSDGWGNPSSTRLNSQAAHRSAVSPLKPIPTSPEEHKGRGEAKLQTCWRDTLLGPLAGLSQESPSSQAPNPPR